MPFAGDTFAAIGSLGCEPVADSKPVRIGLTSSWWGAQKLHKQEIIVDPIRIVLSKWIQVNRPPTHKNTAESQTDTFAIEKRELNAKVTCRY